MIYEMVGNQIVSIPVTMTVINVKVELDENYYVGLCHWRISWAVWVFSIHLVLGVATANSKPEQSALPVTPADETSFRQLLVVHAAVLFARFSNADEREMSPRTRKMLRECR